MHICKLPMKLELLWVVVHFSLQPIVVARFSHPRTIALSRVIEDPFIEPFEELRKDSDAAIEDLERDVRKIVNGTEVGDDSVKKEKSMNARCTLSFEHQFIMSNSPDAPGCPADCPFSQTLPDNKCSKVCIRGDQCLMFHPARGFGDPDTKVCTPTCGSQPENHIAGCAVCASRGVCAKCISSMWGSYTLSSDGKHCRNPLHEFWLMVYAILALTLVAILYYVYCLAFLREGGKEADTKMNLALRHRHLCYPTRLRQDQLAAGDLANEHSDTLQRAAWHSYGHGMFSKSVHTDDVCGIGIRLYFNWLVFCGVCAFVIFLGTHIAFSQIADEYERRQALQKLKCYLHEYSDEKQTLIENSAEFATAMFNCLSVTYMIIMLLSWGFLACQMLLYRWDDDTRSQDSDYCIQISGLPEDVVDEEELKRVLAASTGDIEDEDEAKRIQEEQMKQIVGVSICYQCRDNIEAIEAGLDKWIEEMELEAKTPTTKAKTQSLSLALRNLRDIKEEEGNSKRRWWKLNCIDDYLKGEESQLEKEDIIDAILKMKGSGFAMVVCQDVEARQKLIHNIRKNPYLFDKQNKVNKVKVHKARVGPMAVEWKNYEPQHSRQDFWCKLVSGICYIFGTVVLWAALYVPFAMEYMRVSRVPGEKPSMFSDLILGSLIGLGNVALCTVIEEVIKRAGFESKDNRDVVVLALAFLANMMNVVADCCMTLQVAKGTNLDDSFNGAEVGGHAVLAREIFALIVPGYLFVPYIVQPVLEQILPYWIYRWLVRGNSDNISRRQAERLMEPADFDIVWRYADILCNFLICTILLLFITPNMSKVMLWLLAFMVFIYFQDVYRFFKCCRATFYTTDLLSRHFAAWWSCPTGMLAVVVAFWGLRAHYFEGDALALIGEMFLLHLLIYFAVYFFLFWLIKPPAGLADKNYSDMCKDMAKEGHLWTYMNTNTAHCLRKWCKYNQDHSYGVVAYNIPQQDLPYAPGKAYLLLKVKNFDEDLEQGQIPADLGATPMSRAAHAVGFSFGSSQPTSHPSSRNSSQSDFALTLPGVPSRNTPRGSGSNTNRSDKST